MASLWNSLVFEALGQDFYCIELFQGNLKTGVETEKTKKNQGKLTKAKENQRTTKEHLGFHRGTPTREGFTQIPPTYFPNPPKSFPSRISLCTPLIALQTHLNEASGNYYLLFIK